MEGIKHDALKARYDLVPEGIVKEMLHTDSDGITTLFEEIANKDTINFILLTRIMHVCLAIAGSKTNLMNGIAKVLAYGAKHYGDNNWKLVENAKIRYTNALRRHCHEYVKGNYVNEADGGLLHVWQIATNCVFLNWFEQNPQGENQSGELTKQDGETK